MSEPDDEEAILNPGRARTEARERAQRERTARAWASLCAGTSQVPADAAEAGGVWYSKLASAVESVLLAEWPDDYSSPDGLTDPLITATAAGFDVDAVLHLLPRGTRRVRVEFERAGFCVIHVAAPVESTRASRRLDPRQEMAWSFLIASPRDAD